MTMKNINIFLIILALSLSFSSCEIDNYEEANATFEGWILDHKGNPLQTEQGGGNMTIKMEELSWANGDTAIAIIPNYLNVKQDGSYINTKIFSGEYRVTPVEGPFFPYNPEGEIVNVSGITTKDFTVTPYLNIEWITEPYLNDSAFIRASFRFTRNEKEGELMPYLNNAQMYISTTQYCGRNNYDDKLVDRDMKISTDQEGQTISMVTKRAIKYVGTTYYVRVGVSCKDTYKKYNYTDIKTIEVADDFVIPIL
jgi:hypothetical protein